MDTVDKVLKEYQLFHKGDIVGVGVSGGSDSMCLLHYLNAHKAELGISVVAITIDHGLREQAKQDVLFVKNFCEQNNIGVLSFKGDVANIKLQRKQTIEQAAREFRYGVFEELLANKKVTKIALGHHLQDQTETILLNIFRGTGLLGASGMDIVRDGVYVRPLLTTPKSDIMAYIEANEVPYINDETNQQNEYARNYIRNLIMPLVRNKWKNADKTISNFGAICKQDEEYIQSTISTKGIVVKNGTVTIPISYFVYAESVVKRMLLNALKSIGVSVNIENKHLNLVIDLAMNGENGAHINLPNKVKVYKEYHMLTLTNNLYEPVSQEWAFKTGKIDVSGFGVIEVKKTSKPNIEGFDHYVDAKKLPRGVVWRLREDGDVFEKFGGGTKLLSDFLTNKKVPSRLRKTLPVLAKGNEIFVVAGIEISDKVKLDETTKTRYMIKATRF